VGGDEKGRAGRGGVGGVGKGEGEKGRRRVDERWEWGGEWRR